jgi:hypothetical protein
MKLGYSNVGGAYAGERPRQAKAVRKAGGRYLDSALDHSDLYAFAFLEGDTAAMQRQVDWAKGKPDEFDFLQVAEAAHARKIAGRQGSIQSGSRLTRRGKLDEITARILAASAMEEALVGNAGQARAGASAALAISRSRPARILCASVLALADDTVKSSAMADEVARQFTIHTLINSVFLPTTRALVEIDRGNPTKAIELLRATSAYEFGSQSRALPTYVRGLAYLKAHQGPEAAAEFQRILDHRGVCMTAPYCVIAHLQLGRAAPSGDNAGARTAYQDFLALWKDADPDVPILKEAKAEYAKLPQ